MVEKTLLRYLLVMDLMASQGKNRTIMVLLPLFLVGHLHLKVAGFVYEILEGNIAIDARGIDDNSLHNHAMTMEEMGQIRKQFNELASFLRKIDGLNVEKNCSKE